MEARHRVEDSKEKLGFLTTCVSVFLVVTPNKRDLQRKKISTPFPHSKFHINFLIGQCNQAPHKEGGFEIQEVGSVKSREVQVRVEVSLQPERKSQGVKDGLKFFIASPLVGRAIVPPLESWLGSETCFHLQHKWSYAYSWPTLKRLHRKCKWLEPPLLSTGIQPWVSAQAAAFLQLLLANDWAWQGH